MKDSNAHCEIAKSSSFRGTGEESFLRTESDISAGTNDKTGADRATDTPSIKGAARVVVGTPGSQVLEDLLLQRVFGH
jgi:hypothetical protein